MSELRQRKGSLNSIQSNIISNNNEEIHWFGAAVANVWFIGSSLTLSILTQTYYEFFISFGIHYIVFLCYSWPFHSEKFYDFTGMFTFISLDLFSFLYHKQTFDSIRNIILSVMVLCWTLRLGLTLFWRILQHDGKDSRFNSFRDSFCKYLMVHTMSAQWVYFCMISVLIVNKNEYKSDIYVTDIIGYILFIFGFIIETLSDHQKTMFKANVENKGKFINNGFWKLSRHPNYFGEIVLWFGIAITASSVVEYNTDWLLFVSPLWTVVLLVFMSGIPAAEKTFKSKYKNVKGYKEYINNTPVLIPFCFCWK